MRRRSGGTQRAGTLSQRPYRAATAVLIGVALANALRHLDLPPRRYYTWELESDEVEGEPAGYYDTREGN